MAGWPLPQGSLNDPRLHQAKYFPRLPAAKCPKGLDMAKDSNHIRADLNNRPSGSKMKRAQKAGHSTNSRADGYPAKVIPIIREIQKSGARSLWTIANILNARGIKGARGGKWYVTTVRKFLKQKAR
jgi:Recombinase